MSRLGAVLKNTGYLALAETARPALSFLLILVIARILGRDGMGSYTIVLTFTGLFELIATLGVGPIIVRGIASDPSRISYYVNGAIGVALLASAIVPPVMLIVLNALNYPPDIALGVRLLTWTLLISILRQYALSICEGLQNMRLRAVLSVADTAGRLITGTFMVIEGHGVLGIIEGMILVRVIIVGLAFLIIVRHANLIFDFGLMFRSSAGLALAGLPFLFTTIASAAFWSVNTLMLSKLSSVGDVGIYNAGSRITDILKTFIFSYQIALLPMMSASFVRSRAQFRQECNVSIKYLALLTIPMATGISVLAPRIIHLIFGNKFNASIQVLQVLSWTVCLFSIAMVFARALIASHNQMLDMYCNVVALIVNVVLGWILIHSHGPLGAAIAILVSLATFGLLEYWLVARKLFKPEVIVPLLRACGASMAMGLVIIHLKHMPLVVVILVGSVVYLTTLVCMGSFSPSEMRAARDFMARSLGDVLCRRRKSTPVGILP
jgi:O-antigen/teichoic acid export membrane protein